VSRWVESKDRSRGHVARQYYSSTQSFRQDRGKEKFKSMIACSSCNHASAS